MAIFVYHGSYLIIKMNKGTTTTILPIPLITGVDSSIRRNNDIEFIIRTITLLLLAGREERREYNPKAKLSLYLA